MSNPLLTKYVEFKATGLKQITNQTLSYEKTAKRAEAANKALAKSITDGSFSRATEALKAGRLRMETEIRRNQLLSSQARFGTIGGAVANQANRFANSSPGRAAMGAAVAGSAAYMASAASGFGGTVEGARLEREMRLLNREVAGSMVPQMDALTNAVTGLRKFMEGLSPGAQKMLGMGATGIAGIGAVQGGMAAMGMGHILPGVAVAGAGKAAQLGGAGLTALGGGSIAAGGMLAGPMALMAGAFGMGALMRPEEQRQALGNKGAMALNMTGIGGLGTIIGEIFRGEFELSGPNSTLSNMSPRNSFQLAAEEKRAAAEERTKVTLTGGGFEEAGSAFYRLANAYGAAPDKASKEAEIQEAVKDSLDRLNKNLELQQQMIAQQALR